MNYQLLLNYQNNIAELEYLVNILGWELRTKAPINSQEYLSKILNKHELDLFKLKTSEEYINLLNNYLNSEEVNEHSEEINRYFKQFKKHYELDKMVPEEFYETYSALRIKCNTVWEEAKRCNDYEMYKPYLKDMIEATKKYYQYMYPNSDLYNGMLDSYEVGMTSDVIDKLFNELKISLMPIVKKLPKEVKDKTYLQNYNESDLITAAEYLLNYIGFDIKRGTLGIYPHGFTEKMNHNDVRIAFKKGDNPVDFVSTIIHEGGHGIFEQQINTELGTLQNVCIEECYALHESQSRFYENILGRNINFWKPIYSDIKSLLNLDLTLEEFVSELNNAHPSLIRTEADELTYCFHIIIRYEIERELFNGNINIDELPDIWNNKMKEYLDIEVPNNTLGLMQDVHWSEGNFGYFPSYLLGSIYDGMFIEAIERDLGSIDEILIAGRIKEITEYLGSKIHQYGGAYNSKEVIERVCGKEISAKPLINYFTEKYFKE